MHNLATQVRARQLRGSRPATPGRPAISGVASAVQKHLVIGPSVPGPPTGEAVLQFAISLLRYETIHAQNWDSYQQLLMLCSLPEPACFPIAVRQIVHGVNSGQVGLVPELSQIANSLIVTHSPLRHSSEVANAAYACLAFGLIMNDAAVDAISACDDPVVALLALDCEQRHLTSKPLDLSLWSAHMKDDELYDEFWLLAYEANVKGWLPNVSGIDFVAADPNFASLKSAGVCFYNANLNSPAPLSKASVAYPFPGLPPTPQVPTTPADPNTLPPLPVGTDQTEFESC